jgi:hypothetical protein
MSDSSSLISSPKSDLTSHTRRSASAVKGVAGRLIPTQQRQNVSCQVSVCSLTGVATLLRENTISLTNDPTAESTKEKPLSSRRSCSSRVSAARGMTTWICVWPRKKNIRAYPGCLPSAQKSLSCIRHRNICRHP